MPLNFSELRSTLQNLRDDMGQAVFDVISGMPMEFRTQMSALGFSKPDVDRAYKGIRQQQQTVPVPHPYRSLIEFLKCGASIETALSALDDAAYKWMESADSWEYIVHQQCTQIALGIRI